MHDLLITFVFYFSIQNLKALNFELRNRKQGLILKNNKVGQKSEI